MSFRMVGAIAALGLCDIVLAQKPATPPALGYQDTFQLEYFSNTNNNIEVVNSGFHTNPEFPVTNSDICVNAYTFNIDGTMLGCCSCRLGANGLITIGNLYGPPTEMNPVTAVAIKLVATLPPRVPGGCDARVSPSSNRGVPGGFASGMRAWSTSLSGYFAFGEIQKLRFRYSPLSDLELNKLNTRCAAIAAPAQCSCSIGFVFF